MAAIHLVVADDRSVLPLQRALAEHDLDARVRTAANATIDYRKAPPDGIFVALVGSHAARAECVFVRHFIDWAESHSCETANGAEAVELATNRLALDRALARHGLPMPPTLVVRGRHGAARAVGEFGYPLAIVPALVGDGPVSRTLEGTHDFGDWFETAGAAGPDDQLFLLRRTGDYRQTVRVTLVDGVPVQTVLQAPGDTAAGTARPLPPSILRSIATAMSRRSVSICHSTSRRRTAATSAKRSCGTSRADSSGAIATRSPECSRQSCEIVRRQPKDFFGRPQILLTFAKDRLRVQSRSLETFRKERR